MSRCRGWAPDTQAGRGVDYRGRRPGSRGDPRGREPQRNQPPILTGSTQPRDAPDELLDILPGVEVLVTASRPDMVVINAPRSYPRRKSNVLGCVFGAPPCQGFKGTGRHQPDDPRKELVFEFRRIAREVHPRSFVMENVPVMLDTTSREVMPLIDVALTAEDGGAHPAIRQSSQARTRALRLSLADSSSKSAPNQSKQSFRSPWQACRVAVVPAAAALVSVLDRAAAPVQGTAWDLLQE